ncbi:hypothetical protein [Apibacter muscae]|uniref:hypothetical protein n=1 Tax=Apibacter muscae TaxID=2509004 RepID=UPI00162A383F|nr:hypothetical protein [Apibacter muscae]
MDLEEVKTGSDLRKYIMRLLKNKDKEVEKGSYIYPSLLEYLLMADLGNKIFLI